MKTGKVKCSAQGILTVCMGVVFVSLGHRYLKRHEAGADVSGVARALLLQLYWDFAEGLAADYAELIVPVLNKPQQKNHE